MDCNIWYFPHCGLQNQISSISEKISLLIITVDGIVQKLEAPATGNEAWWCCKKKKKHYAISPNFWQLGSWLNMSHMLERNLDNRIPESRCWWWLEARRCQIIAPRLRRDGAKSEVRITPPLCNVCVQATIFNEQSVHRWAQARFCNYASF